MSLDQLEVLYRERERLAGRPQVIIALHIAEQDIRVLKPRLEAQHMSLSERVRELIHIDAM